MTNLGDIGGAVVSIDDPKPHPTWHWGYWSSWCQVYVPRRWMCCDRVMSMFQAPNMKGITWNCWISFCRKSLDVRSSGSPTSEFVSTWGAWDVNKHVSIIFNPLLGSMCMTEWLNFDYTCDFNVSWTSTWIPHWYINGILKSVQGPGVVISLIFPKVPQSSLWILRVPQEHPLRIDSDRGVALSSKFSTEAAYLNLSTMMTIWVFPRIMLPPNHQFK